MLLFLSVFVNVLVCIASPSGTNHVRNSPRETNEKHLILELILNKACQRTLCTHHIPAVTHCLPKWCTERRIIYQTNRMVYSQHDILCNY